VSVVICAYTSARWVVLQRAVDSVVRQDPPAAELLVVVDHNPELYARACQRWPAVAPGTGCAIRVMQNTGRRGLSGARNTGTRMAGASIVAFLDDDAEAQAGWAELLIASYDDAWVLACGGLATALLPGSRPPWWPAEFDWVVGCSYVGLPATRTDVRNVIGANMSVRRTALTALDGFAEGMGRVGALPFGCEETDFCIRLHQRWPSARIVYEPAAEVLHAVHAERLSWRYFRARCFAEGVSKARVAARVGPRSALSSERSYVARVLPRGVARGIRGACRGDRGALRRAAVIVAGLTMTSAGYARGRLAA
jgi:glycosyltransferase involved in cell wall biosynthesis